MDNYLKIHPDDNVIVALTDLPAGTELKIDGHSVIILNGKIPAKHKFAAEDLHAGSSVIMYGVLVGKAVVDLKKGSLLTTANIQHAAEGFHLAERKANWGKPDVSKWLDTTFNGYHREDGSVGTTNYWIVIPMVFCENRNVEVLKNALVDQLGYGRDSGYQAQVRSFIDDFKSGKSIESFYTSTFNSNSNSKQKEVVFKNVDGVKFLFHTMGCGGTREDARSLCGLLAGYVTHPNVAGATVLSLGCQNAQVEILEEEIRKRSSKFNKPMFVLDQQQAGTEAALLEEAIRLTFIGLINANTCERKPAPLSKLCVGLECGGSDGFSGISANPAVGYTSDLLVALGASVILSEFPELCGVEQNLSDRCVTAEKAERFSTLIREYSEKAESIGSGFYMNPSPGNIKDGLITDAIKSAGAAKKGGTSPVVDVLDYPEKVSIPGLNLLRTPGNDVESTTAEVGSGATVVLFTTGLGTPTGNPIAPVVKIASNTSLYHKMSDIIDINAGTIISGEETIQQAGERILEYVISVASGETKVAAVKNIQDDFIPWKRGISL